METPITHTLVLILRHWWWVGIALLLLLGWFLIKSDGPASFQTYPGVPYRISNDGQWMVTNDGQMIQISDGRVLRSITPFGQAAFSSNGQYLAINRDDHTRPRIHGQYPRVIDIVHISDQRVRMSVPLDVLSLQTMAINEAGTLLAVPGNADTTGGLTIYDTHTGQIRATFSDNGEQFGQLQFTPDDQYLLVVGTRTFRVIDARTWQPVVTNQSVSGGIVAVRFLVVDANHPMLLMVFSDSNSLTLIMMDDRQRIQQTQRFPSPFWGNLIADATLSPNGQYLAVVESPPVGNTMWPIFGSSSPGPVRMALVRVADGVVVQRFEGPRGQMGSPTFTPDRRTIITLGPGPGLGFWQVAPREPWEQWLRVAPFLGALLVLLYGVWQWIVHRA